MNPVILYLASIIMALSYFTVDNKNTLLGSAILFSLFAAVYFK